LTRAHEGRAGLSAVGQQRDPPSRLRFSGIRFGAIDGARAFAAIDHAAAAAPALAASYGVIANARHRKISAIGFNWSRLCCML
jgi:hypothetical protein